MQSFCWFAGQPWAVVTGLTAAVVAGYSPGSLSRKGKRLKVSSGKKSKVTVAIVNLLWRLPRLYRGNCGEARKHNGLNRRGACSAAAVTEGMSGQSRGPAMDYAELCSKCLVQALGLPARNPENDPRQSLTRGDSGCSRQLLTFPGRKPEFASGIWQSVRSG
ncbi:MAG: hypothetical protein RLZZ436_2836 [Planctomycetota bacterium]|jgi:hypothetical protein